MKMLKRILALASAALLISVMALMTGCSTKQSVQDNVPFDFPYPERVNLTWWNAYDATYLTGDFDTIEEHPYLQRMLKETNVYVEYVIPTANTLHGMRDELQNLMAAGECPDMVSQMYHDITKEGNTMDAIIDEEIYLPLNDLIDVQMPNFKSLLEQYAIINKVIRTPQDNIIFIPDLTNLEDYMNPVMTSGIICRRDFLDQLNYDDDWVPVTVADWEEVLRGFETLGVDIPFSAGSMPYAASIGDELFLTCYDQAYEFYLDKETGKVAHGMTTDGMKEYVTTISDWVARGLMVINDISEDPTMEQKLTNEIGAWAGNAVEMMELLKLAPNDDYELVACPDPVLNEGDKITYRGNYRPIGVHTIGNIHLSWDCSQPAIAAKWIDQMFSDEKYMEASYGIEGEDYTKDADGNITFTKKIMENPDGARYGIYQNTFTGSFWRDGNVMVKFGYTAEAVKACEVWSTATRENSMISSDALALTEEEEAVKATFGNFFFIQLSLKGFASGTKPIEEWNDYVNQMYQAGLEELVLIYQNAYDRYLAG